nr:unnamed protein product [Callosobruchus chinensis]
MNARLAKPWTS